MYNYTLLFTFNKDTKTLDLFNSKKENETIYTSKEVERITIDYSIEITN